MLAVLLSERARLDSEWLLCRKLDGRSGSRHAICMRRVPEAIVEVNREALVGQKPTFDNRT
jgi:hypothetical protein